MFFHASTLVKEAVVYRMYVNSSVYDIMLYISILYVICIDSYGSYVEVEELVKLASDHSTGTEKSLETREIAFHTAFDVQSLIR